MVSHSSGCGAIIFYCILRYKFEANSISGFYLNGKLYIWIKVN
jgi:hypothetical protein